MFKIKNLIKIKNLKIQINKMNNLKKLKNKIKNKINKKILKIMKILINEIYKMKLIN